MLELTSNIVNVLNIAEDTLETESYDTRKNSEVTQLKLITYA